MGTRIALLVIVVLCSLAPAAHGAFPYGTPTGDGGYRQPSGANQTPADLGGKLDWMYAATRGSDSEPLAADERELNGIRGAHLADKADVDQAWRTSTGRPDVTIAVLDSGIKWNDIGAMRDLRTKTRITKAETPAPQSDLTGSNGHEPGVDCDEYANASADRDLDGNAVFNVLDYACDSRVSADPANGVGPTFDAKDGAAFDGKPVLDPQDILIAFTDGDDDDKNGYRDDIVGWDFLDDDNDPYDDVQYGHGTGEAKDSGAEADNPAGDERGELGTCPNCMQTHLRVGTSFIADVNRFAQAVIYAVDNDVLVVQEALGTLNKSRLAGQAVDYAWNHGVTTIASAADEAAQHNNWPSSYPRVILVNSITNVDGTPSYVAFNGCTNFNAKIDLAIPSVSCSSDATGRAAGMAGLIHSAALDARAAGRLAPHPTCKRVGGDACALSADEAKQLMASGKLGETPVADDVNFAQDAAGLVPTELTCPVLKCTDPFLGAPPTRAGTSSGASYPARAGHDQFYGYGRVNMNRVLDAIVPPGSGTPASRVPPEVEITSPQWYGMVDPAQETFDVRGRVWARGEQFTCRVLVAPGGYPGEDDFEEVDSAPCASARSARFSGVLASVDVDELQSRFPADQPGSFDGPEHGTAANQPYGGRPNSDPYGFVVKVEATLTGTAPLTGQDRRKLFLHRDAEMVDGWPRQLAGDAEASPLLADLDGDNRNELVVANSDGVVHAWRPDGTDIPGFPVKTDLLPRQTSAAYSNGGADRGSGAVLATPAAGDLDRDGDLELVIADLEGKVYVFDGRGNRLRTLRTNADFSGRPLVPFVNERKGKTDRTQLGFIGSPVLADLDRDDGGRLEIIAAAMDRHVYAWNHDGSDVPGWPVLAVDRSKVAAVDAQSHQVTFKPDAGAKFEQGAIIDTPAVGDLDGPGGDRRPEVVIGTNEAYDDPEDGGFNAFGAETTFNALSGQLELANGRVFAIKPSGEPDDDLLGGASPFRDGWPFKIGILQAGVLPLVGEGVTGSPVIGEVPCAGEERPTVGTVPAAGLAYLVAPDGTSCLGRSGDKDRPLAAEGGASADQPFFAAFGHPAFGEVAGGTAFFAPVAGLGRAADVIAPDYQGGRDQLAGWQPESGQLRPGWPAEVNDLQFLTGPSIADIDPSVPGEEIVDGTASMDLQGFTAAGTDVPGWPKLTGDWTVANPTIGTWGTRETDADTKKVVIAATRSGRILAYRTDAPACADASWPRFHHDLANSGDARRDAIPPGTPTGAALAGSRLTFGAPGDDLLCGRAKRYEVRTDAAPISGRRVAKAQTVAVEAEPKEPGEAEALDLGGTRLGRYVAVRAVDEQGNVGRFAVVDRGAGAGPGSVGDLPGGGGPSGSAPNTGGPGGSSSGRRCLPRRARLTTRGLGRTVRMGASRKALGRRFRGPRGRNVRLRACVRGGGRVITLLRGGRVRAIVSTARGHRARRARPGLRLRTVRSRHPRTVRLARGLYQPWPKSRYAVRVRRGRVTAVAVVARRYVRRSRALRRIARSALVG